MNRPASHGLLRVSLAAPLVLAAACSASPSPDAAPDAGGPTDAGTSVDVPSSEPQSDAPLADAGALRDGGACSLTTLPILPDTTEETFNVPVTDNGKPSAFLIDTGSPSTYVWLPLPDGGISVPDAGDAGASGSGGDAGLAVDAEIAEPDASCAVEQGCVPDSGTVTIGCETLAVPGFAQAGLEPVAGRPVVGTIGDDMLLAGPTWIDLVGNRVVFHGAGDPFPEAASWPAMSLTRPYGYVGVEGVSLNGTPVKLLLDTGSSAVLWLGVQPAPGDMEITALDALGQPVIMYVSKVTVSIGAWSETVQVYKVPSFPYFQPLATATGVDGLFGVSAFPKGVVFDTDARKVRVAQ
jgi:hypothetical protein